MNLAERIKAAEAELLSLKDALVDSTKALEAAPDEESLLAQVEELSAKVEKQTATVDALKRAEAALAARAKVASEQVVGAPAQISSTKNTNRPGDLIFKMGVASLVSFVKKQPIQATLEERYKGDNALAAFADYVQKTAVNPAMTNVAGWAQELVQTDVQGFLDALKNTSVAAAVASRALQLNFGGFNSITVPRRNPHGATLTEPAWVGEAGVIPLTQFSFGAAVINRYKLAAITTFSREIAERSTPAIEGLLRSALSDAYSDVLDAAFLSATAAVANVRPAGVLNGVTAIAGTAGGTEAAVRADVKAAMAAMMGNRMGARPILLLNTVDRLAVSMMTNPLGETPFSGELAAGRLLGMDVISSSNVPKGTMIVIDAAALATAFDAPMFDVSDVATVTEANADGTAPTQATGPAGALGTAGQVPENGGIKVSGATGAATTGYTARSLWQTYSLGIRMVAPTSWALLRPNAVEVVDNLTW